jgi:hypothetical protein
MPPSRSPAQQYAYLPPPVAYGAALAAGRIIQASAMAGAWFLARMAASDNSGRLPVIELKVSEFTKDNIKELSLERLGLLSSEEVQKICQKLEDVRELTKAAVAATRASGISYSPSAFGTAVHKQVKDKVDRQGDSNFVAERAYHKSGDPPQHNEPGWVRVDVLEDVGNGTVCIFDIKTGKGRSGGLSFARMRELATHVLKNFPDARRFVVIEVKEPR